MRVLVLLATALFFGLGVATSFPQASPYSNSVFPAQIFTAAGQTGATIQLNGLVVPSTVGSSFSAGTITVTGNSLTTVTFSVMGSSDNGGNFYPIPINTVANPTGTPTTTVTATANGLYQINLAGLTHIKVVTSGTFTATNVTITLTASPNGQLSKIGGGGGGSSGYFTGPPTLAVTGTPSAHYVPVAVSSSAAVERQLTQDDIAPGFGITGFNCSICGTVEAGVITGSPANFTASYTSIPASASISDGTYTASLSTPFTSGSLAHNYCTAGQGITTITFTLTAIGSSVQAASRQINCTAREFGGVGTAGASGATASGASAVLTGATGTLTTPGGQVGQQSTWGPYTPSNQYIYILGTGGSCTFTSGGFSFLMNAPIPFTFTNQYGAGVSVQLYRSVNLQNAPTTLIGSC